MGTRFTRDSRSERQSPPSRACSYLQGSPAGCCSRPHRPHSLKARTNRRRRRSRPRHQCQAMGAGPAPASRQVAPRSSSTSRKWRAGRTEKHAVFYSAISYMPQGAPKAALGTIKVESDTSVSVGDRLVNFSEFKITESNFPTLAARPASNAHRGNSGRGSAQPARDRARPYVGQYQQERDHPEERRRREGGSADDLLQHDASSARQPRWRPDLELNRQATISSRPSTRIGISSNTARPRPFTCATTTSG